MLSPETTFDGNGFRQQLALVLNLFPGMLVQLTQPRLIGHGGGWIENLHSRCCREVTLEFQRLGFQSLGPLSCRLMPGWVMRGFSHPLEHAWAVHYVGLMFGSQVDFVTEFDDGSWITTTTHAHATSVDARSKSIRALTGRPLAEVWNFHQHHVHVHGRLPMLTGGQRELADAIRRYFNWVGRA